nr:MAG TPA: hypothetical protein [Caudoviricetes sp.]
MISVGAQLESRSFQLGFLSLFIPFCPPLLPRVAHPRSHESTQPPSTVG